MGMLSELWVPYRLVTMASSKGVLKSARAVPHSLPLDVVVDEASSGLVGVVVCETCREWLRRFASCVVESG